MSLSFYAESQTFFDFSCEVADAELGDFHSIRGRARCIAILLGKILIVPFALLYKLYKTCFRFLGLFISGALLLVTLGTSNGAREFFVRRVSSLARDLADWVLYPFAILSCFSKLLLASLIHPALYFRV